MSTDDRIPSSFNTLTTQEKLAIFFTSTFTSGFWLGWLTGKPGKGGGTVSSAVALVFQLILLSMAAPAIVPFAIMVLSFALGTIFVPTAERALIDAFGRRRRHTGEWVHSDFNETTIDELHGQFLAGLPVWFFVGLTFKVQVTLLFLSFLWFRLFDGTKPWPISWVEKTTKGGFGVMIDDTIAGVFAAFMIVIWRILFF